MNKISAIQLQEIIKKINCWGKTATYNCSSEMSVRNIDLLSSPEKQ